MITTQGYNITLTHNNCPDLELLKTKVKSTQELLTREYERIVNNYDDQVYDLIELGFIKGKFVNELNALTKPDYLNWNVKGSRSRLWRMVGSHAYQQYCSRYNKKKIINIIKDNGINNICDDLWDKIRENKIKTTTNELINIFKFLKKDKDQYFKITPVDLDYTTGDSNVKQEIKHNIVHVKIQCDNDDMFDIYYQLPSHLNINNITKVSKPVIKYDEDTDAVKLRYSVFMEVKDSDGDNILGVDLGKIKPFTASIITPQGEYSQELTYSKEIRHLNNKLSRINTIIDSIYNRKKHLELLLNNNDGDLDAYYKWLSLNKEYCNVRTKRTRIKEHLSWLIARDTTAHAVEENCSTIKLEDLSWVGDNGGKWDQSLTQSRIEHRANNNGVKIVKVDAYGTSWEYPEEYEANPAPKSHYNSKTRQLVNENGDRLDKDYTASIAIAARVDKKKARKKNKNRKKKKKNATRVRSIQPKKCRDKFHATPKRPKPQSSKKKKYVLPVVNTFVVNDDFLSHSRSVGVSNTVVLTKLAQVLSNNDMTMIIACLLLSCNH